MDVDRAPDGSAPPHLGGDGLTSQQAPGVPSEQEQQLELLVGEEESLAVEFGDELAREDPKASDGKSPGDPTPRSEIRRSEAKRPTARVPNTPQIACTDTAPTGSSTPTRSKKSTDPTTGRPATELITTAAQFSTNAHPAVIATSPARAPFAVIPTIGFLTDEPDEGHGRHRSGRRREFRRNRNISDRGDRCHGGTRIEAEPPEPQDEDAQQGKRHAVAGDRSRPLVLSVLTDTGPEEDGSDESRPSANRVDDR